MGYMDSATVNTMSVVGLRVVQEIDGLTWEAILIRPGVSTSAPPFDWGEDVLRRDFAVFEGSQIGLYELEEGYYTHVRGPESEALVNLLVKNVAGTCHDVRYETGVGIVAQITFYPNYAWLAENLRTNPNMAGLSIVAEIEGVEKKTVVQVTRIIRCHTVDIVTKPAAGGKFVKVLHDIRERKEKAKVELKKILIAMLASLWPSKYGGAKQTEIEGLCEKELAEIAQAAMAEPPETEEEGVTPQETTQIVAQEDMPATIANLVAALDEVNRRQSEFALTAALDQSRLPENAKVRVRTLFAGRMANADEIATAIQAEHTYLTSLAVPGFEQPDQTRANVGIGQFEKIQVAMDMLFGLTKENIEALRPLRRADNITPVFVIPAMQDLEGVPPFKTIGEAYYLMTGDGEVTGRFNRKLIPKELALMDITSSTFPEALSNTLNKRLVTDYRLVDFQEDRIISLSKSAANFLPQQAINVGYFGDIDDVNPETETYTEIPGVTDEKGTYSVTTKGNRLTITRTTIINDQVQIIQVLVKRLGKALRRTHAKKVWGFVILNGNCTDGTPCFSVPHGNLIALPMTHANVNAAYNAMSLFVEKDSGALLGLLDTPVVKPILYYPPQLRDTAQSILSEDFYYENNDLTTKKQNNLKNLITGAQVHLLGSDPNDWYLMFPSNEIEIIEMAYLHGKWEPEFFLANNPLVGQMFTDDRLVYKFRHEYNGTLVDKNCGVKSVVP